MNRDMLVQLMAGYGSPGTFSRGPYQNDMPEMPRQPQVPPAWLPPGMQIQPGLPQGDFAPTPPDPAYKYVPRFHRLNPAPRDNWRDIQT